MGNGSARPIARFPLRTLVGRPQWRGRACAFIRLEFAANLVWRTISRMNSDIEAISEERARQVVKEANASYFLHDQPEDFFENLDEALTQITGVMSPIGAGFRRNLEAVISAVTLPFMMAMAHTSASHWQRITTSERIRALQLDTTDPAFETIEATRNAVAKKQAYERMQEFMESRAGIRQMASDACTFLVEVAQEESVQRASLELLKQGVVLTWEHLRSLPEMFLLYTSTIILTNQYGYFRASAHESASV